MSMRDYAIDDYGLVLDKNVINDIASQIFEDYIKNTGSDWGYELYDKGICEYVSDFTGEAHKLTDDGTYTWGGDSEYYSCDIISYVPLSKYPTLFNKAYNNMNEIIDEFKVKLGKYLSEDFDYRSRICHISGTYFG